MRAAGISRFKLDGMEIIENLLIQLDEIVIAIEPSMTQRLDYSRFAEGFDTADPMETKALLVERS